MSDRCVVSHDRPLDSEHVLERLLVSVADFEVRPRLPVGGLDARVAHLRAVRVDAARAVHLAQTQLQTRVLEAHALDVVVRQQLDGLLVDLPRSRHAEAVGTAGQVHDVQLVPVCGRRRLARARVDLHGAPGQAVVLLVLGVQQVQLLGLDRARWQRLQRLLEQVPDAL